MLTAKLFRTLTPNSLEFHDGTMAVQGRVATTLLLFIFQL
jgi:hypothetical protein